MAVCKRRKSDASQMLSEAITRLTIGIDTPAIYRALLETNAFGSKIIMDGF
ncbi:MAG: hypothetical protein ACOCU3_00760 [bacterium]